MFSLVTKLQLTKIEELRNDCYKELCFLCLNELDIMIVKLITVNGIHERETGTFDRML